MCLSSSNARLEKWQIREISGKRADEHPEYERHLLQEKTMRKRFATQISYIVWELSLPCLVSLVYLEQLRSSHFAATTAVHEYILVNDTEELRILRGCCQSVAWCIVLVMTFLVIILSGVRMPVIIEILLPDKLLEGANVRRDGSRRLLVCQPRPDT